MKSIRALAAAALAAVSLSLVAVPQASATSTHHPGHGQFVTGVALEVVTTITIRQEIRAVPYVAYTYNGHRYTFGSGPLWAYHMGYCQGRYRSYNPQTNLFLAYSGGHHHCRSPYIQ
jgi:hypothetical protein